MRTVGRLVVAVVERAVVRPVTEGRLRVRGPAGYTAMVVVALLAGLLAVVLAAFAGPLRDRLTLVPTLVGIDAPSEPMGLLLGIFVLALAMVHTSALHAHVGWRVGAIVLVIVYVSAIGPQGYRTDPEVLLLAMVGAVVALVAVQALVWSRRSAWWELVAVLAIYATATLVILGPVLRAGPELGLGDEAETVWLVLQRMAPLAGPVVLVASVAVTQVGLRAAAWTVRGARVLMPGWVAFVLLLVVLVFRVIVDVLGWWDTLEGSATRVLAAAGLLVTGALAWGFTAWAGRRFPRPPLAHLTGDLTTVAIPLAVILLAASMVGLVLSPVGLMLFYAGDHWDQPAVTRLGETLESIGAAATEVGWSRPLTVVGIVVLLLAAALLAARGWRGPSSFVAVLAVVYGTEGLWGLEVPLTYLPLVLTGLTVLVLLVLLIRRRLTTRRVEALTLLVLLTTLLSIRDISGELVTLVIGGVGAVVVSLVWAFLTGGSMTAEAAGRRGRAAWFLGYSLIGFTALAFASLSANPEATYDAEAASDHGVLLFGTALVLTAAVSAFGCVLRDRDLGDLG